jgi:lipoprotein NlpI
MDSRRVSPEESNAAWAATLEGRYAEALQRWDTILAHDRMTLGSFTNRGITRLLVGNLEGALADFLEVRQFPFLPRVQVPFIGTTLWMEGQREAACEDWAAEIARHNAGEFTHITDDAGGIQIPALLWWASAHSSLEHWRALAVKKLRRRAQTKQCQRSRWPGPLAPFLLGRVSNEAIHSMAADSGGFSARARCQASFYLGARYLDAGDFMAYRESLVQAAGQSNRTITQPEYHLAYTELSKMQKD